MDLSPDPGRRFLPLPSCLPACLPVYLPKLPVVQNKTLYWLAFCLSLSLSPLPHHNSIIRPRMDLAEQAEALNRTMALQGAHLGHHDEALHNIREKLDQVTTALSALIVRLEATPTPPRRPQLLLNKLQPPNLPLLRALLPSNPVFPHRLNTPVTLTPVVSFSPSAS